MTHGTGRNAAADQPSPGRAVYAVAFGLPAGTVFFSPAAAAAVPSIWAKANGF